MLKIPMPESDLSPVVPPNATWVKMHYEIKTSSPEVEPTAKLWSGPRENPITVRGPSGDVFVKLRAPQRLSYEKPAGVELKLKVVSYKKTK
jgi:hypothetical protein